MFSIMNQETLSCMSFDLFIDIVNFFIWILALPELDTSKLSKTYFIFRLQAIIVNEDSFNSLWKF